MIVNRWKWNWIIQRKNSNITTIKRLITCLFFLSTTDIDFDRFWLGLTSWSSLSSSVSVISITEPTLKYKKIDLRKYIEYLDSVNSYLFRLRRLNFLWIRLSVNDLRRCDQICCSISLIIFNYVYHSVISPYCLFDDITHFTTNINFKQKRISL